MVKIRFPSLTGGRTFVLIEKETTLLFMKFEQVKLDFIERLTTCYGKFSLVYIEEDCFHEAFMPSYIYLLVSYLIITLILNTQKHIKSHVGVSAQKEMQTNTQNKERSKNVKTKKQTLGS